MDRTQKKEYIDSLHQKLAGGETAVVFQYKGSSVSQMTDLRSQGREADVYMKVTKNTLTKLALKDTQFEGMSDMFTGPTAVAISSDAVAAAKVVYDFAKKNDSIQIVGGGMGAQVLDAQGVEALAKLPSLDELRSKLVGLLVTPAQRIATVTQAPASQVARVVGAYAEKG